MNECNPLHFILLEFFKKHSVTTLLLRQILDEIKLDLEHTKKNNAFCKKTIEQYKISNEIFTELTSLNPTLLRNPITLQFYRPAINGLKQQIVSV